MNKGEFTTYDKLEVYHKYPFFKRSIFISLLASILVILFWRSFVLAACVASLPIIIGLLWRKDETPVFVLALSFQWLQVSIGIIWRDMFGIYLNAVDHPKIDLACYLGIISVTILAVGIRIGFSLIKDSSTIDYTKQINHTIYSVKKIFLLYLIVLFVYPSILVISFRYLQIATILRFIIVIQHVLLFLLFFLAVIYNRYLFALLALVLEVIYGMTGYFSGYKSAIFLFIMAGLTSMKKITIKRKSMLLAALVSLFIFTMIWQAIKPQLRRAIDVGEFRGFGANKEKVEFVYRLGEEFIREDRGISEGGMNSLVSRISYIYYFACTLEMIPDILQHERGKLFLGTIKHLLKPRLLFPEKEILPTDSWMVRKYTGVMVAGDESFTSIGLGYPVEYYIDFGIPWMFIPVFFFGIITGVLYRFIFKIALNALFANALVTAIFFFYFYSFASANIKLWGGLFSTYTISILSLVMLQKKLLAYIIRKNYKKTF